ncbi:hypothetical protein J4212_03525 [Candidatus Woesearchaeota archaeon]|nr:hypothetical protein [Candidatus Woesearchaeota archaeon]
MDSGALILSRKRLNAADRILNELYPAFLDGRLLLSAARGILAAYSHAIKELSANGMKGAIGYALDEKAKESLEELREIMAMHRKSPVEFERKGRFVICDSNYSMRILSHDMLKEHALNAKSFIGRAVTLLEKGQLRENERSL